jgi:hypothetical protein
MSDDPQPDPNPDDPPVFPPGHEIPEVRPPMSIDIPKPEWPDVKPIPEIRDELNG